jgi:hypothetical protein
MATKKESRGVKRNKLINQAKREVPGFTELLDRFERTVSVLGRSQSTLTTILATSLLFHSVLAKSPPCLIQNKYMITCFIFKKIKNSLANLF